MDYLTVDEVAARLRVASKTVRRWCAAEQLKAVRAGRQWRILPTDLEAFLKAQGKGGDTEGKNTAGLATIIARPAGVGVVA